LDKLYKKLIKEIEAGGFLWRQKLKHLSI
jgi:hypothetical protein